MPTVTMDYRNQHWSTRLSRVNAARQNASKWMTLAVVMEDWRPDRYFDALYGYLRHCPSQYLEPWLASFSKSVFYAGRLTSKGVATRLEYQHHDAGFIMAGSSSPSDNPHRALDSLLQRFSSCYQPGPEDNATLMLGGDGDCTLEICIDGMSLTRYLVHLTHTIVEAWMIGVDRPRVIQLRHFSGELTPMKNDMYARIEQRDDGELCCITRFYADLDVSSAPRG